jgi:hypothetical protein
MRVEPAEERDSSATDAVKRRLSRDRTVTRATY